ncbi:hypothetical protein BH18ACT4_BH18ACT4_02440 [soil metagenome]
MRAALLSGIVLWVGTTLVLGELRWFQRRPLTERLRPYLPGAGEPGGPAGVLSAGSFREVIGPVCREVGELLSRLLGVSESLATRLERTRSPLDATSFRVRQLGWTVAGFGAGALVALVLRLSAPMATLFVMGAPCLAFLVVEQNLAKASRSRQQRLVLELPVVTEQLGMLLSAGFSLGAALNRLAERGRGVCGSDLAVVCGRIRQGLSEVDALREWATLADVDALDRLVKVLALNREASDLGRLISEEARGIRRDVQRRLVETIERRGKQVWIQVTVATLVPGVIFVAVPFIEAMRLFSGS